MIRQYSALASARCIRYVLGSSPRLLLISRPGETCLLTRQLLVQNSLVYKYLVSVRWGISGDPK